ncbi:hypothetical protein BD410DRAFT_486034 [Rickenella mellea]|uniref:Uncharacterized protein n=1 Tax=Rickenella mellea TaxID=50990 RepID=A0A4Y7QJP7_9AGAM|nr:hypothetical protein BD410DRAFT_486034 [Rickenella mellea]
MELTNLKRFNSRISKLKSSYDRIRLSRLFSAYVVLALVFCLLQVTTEFLAFLNNNAASARFSSIIEQAKIPRRFAYLLPNNTILICDDIRGNQNCKIAGSTFEAMISPISTDSPTSSGVTTTLPSTRLSGTSVPAPTVTTLRPRPHDRESEQPPSRFAGRHALSPGIESSHALARRSIYHNRRGLNIQPQFNSSGDIESLTLTGLNGQSQPVTLSMGCIESLAWPDILFRAARREDFTLMLFRVWVLAMSVASIIYDSIPHLWVAFLGNCAGLGWSISQVTLTARFSEVFYKAITINACGGIELRSPRELQRNEQAIAGAIISGSFSPFFVFLSFKIFQIYRHQSFQRVGATKKVYNIYTLAMGFCVCLHLSGFLVMSTSLLWLDEMLTGVIRKYLHSTTVFITGFLLGVVGYIPWLLMGSKIVFRERKKLMLAFLVLGFGLSVLWTVTLTNPLFQYTLGQWPFFASLSILSFTVLVATTALGIVCRYNFGNGLKHYIMVLEVLEEVKFTPGVFSHDPEKSEIAAPQQNARIAALTARDSAVLAGIPILIPTLSTTSSFDEACTDLPSTETPTGPIELAHSLNGSVGQPRPTSHFSGNSDGTGVTVLSWTSWLWSRGVAAISRSRTPSPTALTAFPSSYRARSLRHSTGTPTSRFSYSSYSMSAPTSATLMTSDAAQFVKNLFISTSTSEPASDTFVQLDPPAPLPARPR